MLGENGRLAFAQLQDDVICDLYTKIVPSIPADDLVMLLENAWNCKDAAAEEETRQRIVQIIFQTGNVRRDDGGKADARNFLLSLLWLWDHNAKSVLANVHAMPAHTCLKHVLDLLAFALASEVNMCPSWELYAAMHEEQTESAHKKMKYKMDTAKSKKRDFARQVYSNALRVAFATRASGASWRILAAHRAAIANSRAARVW